METQDIIKTYLTQGKHNNPTNEDFYNSLSIKLGRRELIQVLMEKNHMDEVIPRHKQSKWFDLCNWSNLVSMIDCCLGLKTDSYLSTLD